MKTKWANPTASRRMDGPLIVKLDKVVHYNLKQNRTKGQRGGSLYRVRP